ncbi:hypothetical protein F4212_06860 [Candidatus Poribacteria bacterium]|nr:hypothetical protein [Candidatus Poribacteria bacterium]
MNIAKDIQRLIKPHKHKNGQIREEVDKKKFAEGYTYFAEMIGIADFGTADASVNHDDVIYELQSKS